MKNTTLFCISAVILLSILFTGAVFSEEGGQPVADQIQGGPGTSTAEMAPAPAIAEVTPVGKELSIYGEVQSVNAAANSLTVQYYDYDSDEEKVIEIAADNNTRFENASAVGNITKADWVDVTYVAENGKNIAKSVLVEKEEKDEVGSVTVPPEANTAAPAADVE